MAKNRRTVKKSQTELNEKKLSSVDITSLVKSAQLCYLRMRKSESELLVIPESPPELRQTIQVEARLADAEPNSFIVLLELSLDGKDTLNIGATYEIMYKYDASIEAAPDQMAAFGKLIGINNVWPYWREYIHSMTSRMGLPTLTLPLFRPPEHTMETARKQAARSKKKKHAIAKNKSGKP